MTHDHVKLGGRNSLTAWPFARLIVGRLLREHDEPVRSCRLHDRRGGHNACDSAVARVAIQLCPSLPACPALWPRRWRRPAIPPAGRPRPPRPAQHCAHDALGGSPFPTEAVESSWSQCLFGSTSRRHPTSTCCPPLAPVGTLRARRSRRRRGPPSAVNGRLTPQSCRFQQRSKCHCWAQLQTLIAW